MAAAAVPTWELEGGTDDVVDDFKEEEDIFVCLGKGLLGPLALGTSRKGETGFFKCIVKLHVRLRS